MVEPIRRADMKALVSRKPQRLPLKWLSQVYEVLLPWVDLKVLRSEDVLHEVNKQIYIVCPFSFHTSYLSFFLHGQNLHQNLHSKLPIYTVNCQFTQ